MRAVPCCVMLAQLRQPGQHGTALHAGVNTNCVLIHAKESSTHHFTMFYLLKMNAVRRFVFERRSKKLLFESKRTTNASAKTCF